MQTKNIEQVLAPPAPHMVGDGFRVHNFFPNGYKLGKKRMSPFFLMDYNAEMDFPAKKEPRGVGVHPHRGFETVTIAYEGAVAHHDSAGNSGVIHKGDVQWMTAGAGILHKEYHDKLYSETGGPFQMVQLWVNLPAAFKMTTPRYQALTSDTIPRVPVAGGEVAVIAGAFNKVKGAAATFSALHVYNVQLTAGANINLPLPAHFNTGLLVVKGSVRVNDTAVAADHFVLFKNDGEDIRLEATSDATVLVLSGEPIDEPLAAYGPFLMNNYDEIQQAYSDFNKGRFGYLE